MPGKSWRETFERMGEWCTVTYTGYDDDSFLGIQTDAHGQELRARDCELHHPYGFMGRPRDPDTDGLGCVAWKWQDGSESHAWLADDPRVTPDLPELDKGGSVFYGGSSTLSWCLIEDDGSVEFYIPYDPTAAGVPQKCFALRFDVSTEAITLQHSAGQTVCLTKEKEIVLAVDNDTHLTLAPGKITLQAEQVLSQGATVVGNVATAAPLNQTSTSARLFISAA